MESGPFSPLPDILGLGNEVCPHRIYAKSWSIILDIVRSTDSFSIVATNRKAYTTIPYYDGVRSLELLDCDCYNIMGWITRKNAVLSDLARNFCRFCQAIFKKWKGDTKQMFSFRFFVLVIIFIYNVYRR